MCEKDEGFNLPASMYRCGRVGAPISTRWAVRPPPLRRAYASTTSVAVLRDKETGKEWVIQPRSNPAATVRLPALVGCAIVPSVAMLLAPQAAGLAALATPGAQLEFCSAVGGPAVELGAAVAPMVSEAFAGFLAPVMGDLGAALAPMMQECTAATAGGQAGTAIACAVTQHLVDQRR